MSPDTDKRIIGMAFGSILITKGFVASSGNIFTIKSSFSRISFALRSKSIPHSNSNITKDCPVAETD